MIAALAIACGGPGPPGDADASTDGTGLDDSAPSLDAPDVPGEDVPPPRCLGDTGTVPPAPDAGVTIAGLALGERHTCVALGDHTVRCWGDNSRGQLGDGTTTRRLVPTVVPGLTDATQIVAGGFHTCALRANGAIACWGDNSSGQLGDGTTANRLVPTPVMFIPGMVPTVVEVVTATYHTCARTVEGNVFCWGRDGENQLGDDSRTDKAQPVMITGATFVTSISVGPFHSCATIGDGTASCWGSNSEGQLGDCLGARHPIPNTVVSPASFPLQPFRGATQIAAGGAHTCVRMSDGTAQCWGQGVRGQLGFVPPATGNCQFAMAFMNHAYAPFQVPFLRNVARVSAGAFDTCALLTDGTVQCFGANLYGQLGSCAIGNQMMPTTVPGLAGITNVVLGSAHTCAVQGTTAVFCWGDNEDGRLGDGTTISRATPQPVLF